MNEPIEPANPYDVIDELETQVSALQDKVISLESDLDLFKNIITQMCGLDALHDEPIQAWEIRDALYKWAYGRKS